MLVIPAHARPRSRGVRLLVTDTPESAGLPACTPATAARLVLAGAGVALVDEAAGDARQWVHLLTPPPAGGAAAVLGGEAA